MAEIQKVLIANRGEIAVRVIRTCREMGIATVAVHSEVDARAMHVRLADEAVSLGPPEPRASYLDMQKIIAAAKRTGAKAIHPGYGFLSENAAFARAVEEAGIVWIGPPWRSMELLGNKLASRKTARSLGIPTVPGTDDPVSGAQARAAAREVGFPIMLKAAAGGGGKGIRLVRDETELARELEIAASEAGASFGQAAVFLERQVSPARHIEVQVMGDAHGRVIHLGERECSLQRRHQKIVEETPSPVVSPELRAELGAAAVRLAEHAGYRNAGTVEFLVDERMSFYLLEVNCRLQVEHPVTEMVTGLDLVRLQLEVAAGAPLPLRQDDVRARGHAIELRVTAEDPFGGFVPSAGKVRGLHLPGGPFTRVDTALYEGDEVSLHYDALLAKLAVWGEDRERAIDRLVRAASELQLSGLATTLPLAPLLARDADFRAARFHTRWLEPFVERVARERPTDDAAMIAAVAATLAQHAGARAPRTVAAGTRGPSAWTLGGRPGMGG